MNAHEADPVAAATDRLTTAVESLRRELATDAASLAAVSAAVATRQAADAVIPATVDVARSAGRTWQEIGDILGISRQAAFQRFGHPTDPRTGHPMDKTPLPNSDERATEAFERMRAGKWHDIYSDFDTAMQEKLPEDQLSAVWAQVIATVGELDATGSPTARRAADHTVVDVPLTFEAAKMVGRVSFDNSGRIAGFFVLTPEQAQSL